jgi:hypothetical protein
MELIVTTREDLQAIIRESVAEALQSIQQAPPLKDIMPINETVQYMYERGYITTVGSVYNCVSKQCIPHRKVNGKLVFERKAIDGWIDLKRTKKPQKQ